MNLPNLTALDFLPLWPALVLSLGATLLLLSEVFLATSSRRYQSILACVSAGIAGLVALRNAGETPREVFLGFGVMDPFSSVATAVICLATALASAGSAAFLHRRQAERGEFYALMLFGAAGMSLLAHSAELITLFISLELLSVSTYALTAYLRRGSRPSEAGFKYFILGAFSTALLLYGAALLYGATGSTMLQRMAGPLAGAMRTQPGIALSGLLLVAAGFAFKVAAVPFHMWTPDVYEGAPTPVTGLMSAGVKAAAFAAMVRVFTVLGRDLDPTLLTTLFSALAVATMVGGNLLAVPQRNVKRMLAYSSIAHAGYLLAGVAALFARPMASVGGGLRLFGSSPLVSQVQASRTDALKGILFYLLAYTVTAIGAFIMVGALERREDEDRGTAWDLDRFAGLSQRRPGWALAMAAFMLSLGGIPPTVGFMAKLLIFRSAVDAGLVGLAIVGVLSSAVGVYYYLRVVVYMYMRPAAEDAPSTEHSLSTELVLAAATIAVVALGVLPGPLGAWLQSVGQLWGGSP